VWIPLVSMLGLSAFGAYPLLTRVSTFYYPLVLLALALAADALWRRFVPARLETLGCAAAGVALGLAVLSLPPSANPGATRNLAEGSDLLAHLAAEGRQSQRLYLNGPAVHLMKFYRIERPGRFRRIPLPTPDPPDPEDVRRRAQDLVSEGAGGVAWIFFLHANDYRDAYLRALAELGVVPQTDIERRGAFLLGFAIPRALGDE
jgi:hypothetical protein